MSLTTLSEDLINAIIQKYGRLQKLNLSKNGNRIRLLRLILFMICLPYKDLKILKTSNYLFI